MAPAPDNADSWERDGTEKRLPGRAEATEPGVDEPEHVVAVGRSWLIAAAQSRTCACTHTAPTLDEWRRSAGELRLRKHAAQPGFQVIPAVDRLIIPC